MADLDAALMKQFLNVTVAQREAVIEPDSVLDDGHRKAVGVGLEIGHGRLAYPDRVKVIQPILRALWESEKVTRFPRSRNSNLGLEQRLRICTSGFPS